MKSRWLRILCLGIAWAVPWPLYAGPAGAETIELSRGADLVVYGLHPSARTGETLARGDFDGDGQVDLAIGAPGGSPDFEPAQCPGIIYILWGGADVRERAAAGLHKLPNRIAGSRNGHGIGSNVAAGDFDGDGRDDLLIGAPWTTEPGAPDTSGAAYLVLGRPRAEFPPLLVIPEHAEAVFLPDRPFVHLGEAVALGDWDGDGKADAILGAMYENGFDNARPHAGAAYIVLGRERKKIVARLPVAKGSDLAIHGADRDDTLGRSLALTDWNGDRRQDLVVGAYYGDGPFNTRDNPGEAYLVLGRERKELKRIKNGILDLGVQGSATPIFGAWPYGATARVVAGGDFDGDGWGDAAIGTYLGPDTEDSYHCGIADVVFGAFQTSEAIDLASAPQLRVVGGIPYDQAGRPLAGGDLDGDGRDELLVGETFADPIGPDSIPRLQAGEIGIVKGQPRRDKRRTIDGSKEPFDHVLLGIDAEDQIPSSIATLDLDGDGKVDLVIGAALTSGRKNEMILAGEVYFLFGAERSW